MSSFICSAKHYNSCEHRLMRAIAQREISCPEGFKKWTPNWYKGLPTDYIEAEISQIFDYLKWLNVTTSILRYRAYHSNIDKAIQDQYQLVRIDTPIQYLSLLGLFKGLSCIEYQIEVQELRELRELTEMEYRSWGFLMFLREMLGTVILMKIDDKTNNWEV